MKKLKDMSIRYSAMLILIFMLVPTIAIIFGINYFNVKKNILNNTDIAMNQSKYFITETITSTENNYEFISNHYALRMTESLKYFQKEYLKNKADLSKIDLEEMKRRYNNLLDFYIINKDGVIIYSTTPVSLGLDFKKYGFFYEALTKIRKGDKIEISNVTSEIGTNKLRKWGYAPTEDHEYVLEVGVSSDELMKYIKKIDYGAMEKIIKSKNPYIKKLTVYDKHYTNLNNYSEDTTIDEKEILRKVILSRKDYTIKNKDGFIKKEYIFIDTFSNILNDSEKVILLEYDYNIIYEKIYHINMKLLTAMFFCTIVSLSIIFFAISKMITEPIINLIKHIKQISYKNLSLQLEVNGKNEIGELASSFNEMSLKLKKTLISRKNIKMTNEKLKKENTKDWLTKIYNKKYITQYLIDSQKKSNIDGSELSVIMCDIDHFKDVNDTYGHPVGDIVLQEIASIIEKFTRNTDAVGRYGGEEFLIVLPNTTLIESWDIFERIRKNIEKHSFSHLNIPVTISGGLVSTKKNKDDNLIAVADKHLYLAKANGRNQGFK